MTMVNVVLAPQYALSVADTLQTNQDGSVQSGHDKLHVSTDNKHLFGTAGGPEFHNTYLPAVKSFQQPGVEIDDAIMALYIACSRFAIFPSRPPFEAPTQETLHVFRESDRFISCLTRGCPSFFERRYDRSNQKELRVVGVGVGGIEAMELVSKEEPFKTEWQGLRNELSLDAFDDVFDFWRRVNKEISRRPNTGTGNTLNALRMTVDDPVWHRLTPQPVQDAGQEM